MTETNPIYQVAVTGFEVEIHRLNHQDEGYQSARDHAIRRDRDAIDLSIQKRDKGESEDGIYTFLLLENARAFALLQLKFIEDKVSGNLDRIQAFTG